MLNVKKLAAAAALSLCAVSATASNFRAADQVYIPVAGHTAGGSGTFISDVFISNLSDDPVEISVIYSSGQNGAVTEYEDLIRLAPRERAEYVDFFVSKLNVSSGFGQLIFNACRADADCGPASQDENGNSPNFRNISVSSRIYSIPPGTNLTDNPAPPTTGQFFAGTPWYHFVTQLQAANGLDRVFIHGLRNTGGVGTAGTYRSNIGLVNASQFSTTELVVRLFNGLTGQQVGSDFVQPLGPLGQVQVNVAAAFPSFTGATATNGYITVQQRNTVKTQDAPAACNDGCPAFLAYASVLDNRSGDATTLEAVYERALTGAAIDVIYPNGSGKSTLRRSVGR
ncbi:MAG TPA: hypothetical protein VF618_18265 [Thermoanaerobaculia bacterium]